MDNAHGNNVTCCVSCFLVMADLRGSDCLSVEEYTTVFKSYLQWERRLLKKVVVKESDVIKKVAAIMDKHVPSREESRVLNGIHIEDWCSCNCKLHV